jgi:hypothetical protein
MRPVKLSAAAVLCSLAAACVPGALWPAEAVPRRVEARERLVAATREVVQEIVRAAKENARLPATGGGPRRRLGDELTEFYVRRAAAAAARLNNETAGPALLHALGIALDDSDLVRGSPLLGDFCRVVESADERTERLRVLGGPTMRGRRDSAQHFLVSAFLTAQHGALAAEAAGLAKELRDAQGGTGFSFADLAADKAGVLFATRVLQGRLDPPQLANTFAAPAFLPSMANLPEGLSWSSFSAEYGSPSDERYQRVVNDIQQRIDALPAYR